MLKLAFGLLALIIAAAPHEAAAYELTGPRWDHSCLTTDGTPQLVAALAKWAAVSGVTDCGVTLNPDLRVRDALPASTGAASIELLPFGGLSIEVCTIYIRNDARADAYIWAHEVGHCLGLAHSAEPYSVMAALPRGWLTEPQPDDIAGAQAIFGPPRRPFRTLVAGLAN